MRSVVAQERPPRVALIMVVVSDLAGSGGSERLFGHLHEHFASDPRADVTLVTASTSASRLQAAGRIADRRRVITIPAGPRPGRGRHGVIWMTACLVWVTLLQRFDIVHVCLPSPVYVPYLTALRLLPRRLRPRQVTTVVDCTLADSLVHPPPVGTYERQVLDAFRMYARWTRLDGLYSWYRAFVDRSATLHAARSPLVRAARYCFTDPQRFQPAPVKERLIVFAGRLSEQKRPLVFVDAIAHLVADEPDLVAGWRFEMYGQGILAESVADRIAARGLTGRVTLSHAIDLAPVFARSRLFVSTQAFENFTSLAMLEAMAAGNAVIAENVGQTGEFVRERENGYLVEHGSAEAFASALATYLRHNERHDHMAEASRRLTTTVHTVEHFADDITMFWLDVLRQPA